MQIRKVVIYADTLFISPTYLNDTVREITSQLARQLIYDRLILEAKAKLIQSTSTVTEIVYQLQFKDSSYFCRFLKKKQG